MAHDRSVYFRWIQISVAALSLSAGTPSRADECGVLKPFPIHVQKIAHRNSIDMPLANCKTAEGPCKASGYEFVVSSKTTKYKIFLVDGTVSKLTVGSDYTARLTCGDVRMMMVTAGEVESDRKSLFVLEEEEIHSRRD
jgi:hypothetical protein